MSDYVAGEDLKKGELLILKDGVVFKAEGAEDSDPDKLGSRGCIAYLCADHFKKIGVLNETFIIVYSVKKEGCELCIMEADKD